MQKPSIDVPLNSSMVASTNCSSDVNRVLMRKQLALLLHAEQCRRRMSLETAQAETCQIRHCPVMRQVLCHIERCVDGNGCTVSHCRSSRLILSHFRLCKSKFCDICCAVRKPTVKSEQQHENQNNFRNPDIHNGPYPGPDAINSESKSDISLLNGTKNSPSPRGDSIVPCTSFTINGEVHRSNRNNFHLSDQQRELAMKKFVNVALSIFPTPTSTAYSDPRMKQFLDHVKRMEKDIFMKSKSAEEYYASLTACYQSIHSELREKRRLRGSRPPDSQSEQSDLAAIENQLQSPDNVRQTAESQASDPVTDRNQCKVDDSSDMRRSAPTPVETQGSVSNEDGEKAADPIDSKDQKPAMEDLKQEESDAQTLASRESSSRAVWYPNDLMRHFLPVVERISKEKDAEPFLQPVDWEALEIFDYPEVVTHPMDLSTIRNKLENREYKEPWDVVDDFWLMLNNAWLYNKKTSKVYKTCTRLAELFETTIDPVMQSLGFCCGREYYYQPPPLTCLTPKFCTIHRDAVYYVYNNENHIPGLLEQKYTVCERCYNEAGDQIRLDSESPTVVTVQKSLMEKCKNDRKEKEPFVFCRKCGRKWHRVCAIHMDEIWPEGFTCGRCMKDLSIKRADNRFTAKRLATCKLSNFLEKRVNDFLKKKGVNTGEVIIRVLASADKTVEVKPGMKTRFCETGEMPESFPYRVKAIFAFQEIDGQEVCFFGLHVQEYGSECPFPNTRRVYLAYLDSVYFFRPKEYRTDIYHEILVGYINYAKLLGFSVAHIWACPPSEGDDYIFHMHPADQKIPKPKRLQEWYQKMLKKALLERIVVDYKDICQDAYESRLVSPTELAYFEGDFWPNTLEELFKEMDEEDARRKREQEALARDDDEDDIKENVQTTEAESQNPGKKKAKKRKLKRNASMSVTGKRKRLGAGGTGDFGNEVARRVYEIMEKHKENFFVIRLHPQNMIASLPPIKDPDPLISSDLMECRGAFLERAREKHLEFSTVRRAKYSTMAMLYDLHTENRQPLMYTCNACNLQLETPWHCKQCAEYDLCPRCYETEKHPHPMVQVGLGLDDGTKGSDADSESAAVQESGRDKLSRFVKALGHGCSCRDANCRVAACKTMKSNVQHFRAHTAAARNQCPICRSLKFLCYYHSKTCHEVKCPVPLCPKLKAKMKQQQKQQRLEQTQMLRRRMATMQRYNSVTPSQQPNMPMASKPPHPQSSTVEYVSSPVSSSAQSSPYPSAVSGPSFAPMASPMSRTPASLPSPQQYSQVNPGSLTQQAHSKQYTPGSTIMTSPTLMSPQHVGYAPHSSASPYSMPHHSNVYNEMTDVAKTEHVGAPVYGQPISRTQSMLNTSAYVQHSPYHMDRVHSAQFVVSPNAQMTAPQQVPPQMVKHASMPPASPRSQQMYLSHNEVPTYGTFPAQQDDQASPYTHSKQTQRFSNDVPNIPQNPASWRSGLPNASGYPRGSTSPCTPNVTVARPTGGTGPSPSMDCTTPPVCSLSVSPEDVHLVKQAYNELRQRGAPFSEFSNWLNSNPHLLRAWQFIQQSHIYAQQQQQQQQQSSVGPGSHPNFVSPQQLQPSNIPSAAQCMMPRTVRHAAPQPQQWMQQQQQQQQQQQLRSRLGPPNPSQFYYSPSNKMSGPIPNASQAQLAPNQRYLITPNSGQQQLIAPQVSVSPPPGSSFQRTGSMSGNQPPQMLNRPMSMISGASGGGTFPMRPNHPMHSSVMLSQLLGPTNGNLTSIYSSQYPISSIPTALMSQPQIGGYPVSSTQQQPSNPSHFHDPNNML